MVQNAIFLFITTMLSGMIFFLLPKKAQKHSDLLLIFGGSYLFSLTLVDLLPHVYLFAQSNHMVIYALLIGFFLQFFLDLLSQGVAHGHMHSVEIHSKISSLGLLGALFLHAIFDGLLIGGAQHLISDIHHGHTHHHGLLSGIILHKLPTTLSFIAILVQQQHSKSSLLLYLLIFALGSPLGCFIASFLQSSSVIQTPLMIGWGLAVGNLLHIATTILSESNADHHFKWASFLANLLGALLAILNFIH